MAQAADMSAKLGTYRQNLSNTSASKIEIGFLIEIHSDFSGYFINDEQGTRKVERVSGGLAS